MCVAVFFSMCVLVKESPDLLGLKRLKRRIDEYERAINKRPFLKLVICLNL